MVLGELLDLYPDADIRTLLYDPGSQIGKIERKTIQTSALQKVPFSIKNFRMYLPLMPIMIEQFDLDDADLIFSNSCAVAHGVLSRPDQIHVAYLNRTMRYAWDLYQSDLRQFGVDRGLRRVLASSAYHYIRLWDFQAMQRPDLIISNSRTNAARIKKYYHRTSEVVYPPVETTKFYAEEQREEYYVFIGRLVPLKNVGQIVEAFNANGKMLYVVGDGPLRDELEATAKPNIVFCGQQSRIEIAQLLGRAKAFVNMSDEDFGIAVVEAQAAGAPVVAWNIGGVRETVLEGRTGVLFDERTPTALNKAIERLEQLTFIPEFLQAHAKQFDSERFKRQIMHLVDAACSGHKRLQR